jgi:putative two-component system response regulator
MRSLTPRPEDTVDQPGHVLIVDDHCESGLMLSRLLELSGHTVEVVYNGVAAFQAIETRPPDLVVLDVQLPDMDGYTICARLKHDPATWRIPVILVTGYGANEARLRSIEAEADEYLQKPVNPQELELWVRTLLRAKRRNDLLERADDVIFALARAIEAKDSYTEGHLQRMAAYAVAMGRQLGLGRDEMTALRYGALLHDVGKLGIDEMIIRKGGPLTPAEYRLMQQHPVIGERIVQPLHMAAAVAPIVRHHHERWDGRGYPDGLAGENIPLGARIVAVADAFDAMTTQRPYNRILSFEEARARLAAGAGMYWDPHVVAIFVAWLQSNRA